MSKISQAVSTILDAHIPEGKWKNMVDAIDRAGEPTQKHMTAILFTLCQQIEEIEAKLDDLERKPHAPTRS